MIKYYKVVRVAEKCAKGFLCDESGNKLNGAISRIEYGDFCEDAVREHFNYMQLISEDTIFAEVI